MTLSSNIIRQIVLSEQLIQTMKQGGNLHSSVVEDAFRAVSRHFFLPGKPIEVAYVDAVIPLKQRRGTLVSSASAPSVIASLLEQLYVQPGQRVLEIGAGTGYTAGLLSHLVGPSGEVVTLDIDRAITRQATNNLQSAGLDQVKVVLGDGAGGCPPSAPYDRIILTVGTAAIAPPWVEQLAPDGRLVLPLWVRGAQFTVAFERTNDGLTSRSIQQHPFVRLQGKFAGGERMVESRGIDGLTFSMQKCDARQAKEIERLLLSDGITVPTDLVVDPHEARTGLMPWLATHHAHHILIGAENLATAIVPGLYHERQIQFTSGVRNRGGLAILGPGDVTLSSELFVKYTGRRNPTGDIYELAKQWDSCHRPTLKSLEISAVRQSRHEAVNGIGAEKAFDLRYRWLIS
jgi:protein-L-isoaspartate(D-aspartate) O-methyltransferase